MLDKVLSRMHCTQPAYSYRAFFIVFQGQLKPEDFVQANSPRVEAVVTNNFQVVSQGGMHLFTMTLQALTIIGVVFLQRKRSVFL